MRWVGLLAVPLVALWVEASLAACAVTYNFVSGTTAVADNVDTNYSDLRTCIEALQAGTGITALDVDIITDDANEDNDLDVAAGGTGVSTLTDGGVLIGNGTGDFVATAVLTEGQLLIGDGTTDPAVAAMSGDATMASSGALTIAAGAVEAVMVAADVATQAELDAKSASTSVDNTVTRFDSTSGDVQGSGVIIDDSDNLAVPGAIIGGTGSGVGACMILYDIDDPTDHTAVWTVDGVLFDEVDTNGVCNDAT